MYKELYKKINILRLGATTKDFPMFGQYLHIEDNKLYTCNGDIYLCLDYETDLKGDINIHILNNILSMFYNNKDLKINKTNDKLLIQTNNYKTELPIVDISFPYMNKPQIEYFSLTESIINIFKLALNFVTKEENSLRDILFIRNNIICSSDDTRVFYHKSDIDFGDDSFGVSRKLLPLLSDQVKIGVNALNTCVDFGNGYGIFSLFDMQKYPIDNIETTLSVVQDESDYVCNIAPVLDAVDKLQPIFYKEKEQILTCTNMHNKFTITATSAINGQSVVELDSRLDKRFIFNINLNKFKNIPISFDLYTKIENDKSVDYIYLKDNIMNSEIIIRTDRI